MDNLWYAASSRFLAGSFAIMQSHILASSQHNRMYTLGDIEIGKGHFNAHYVPLNVHLHVTISRTDKKKKLRVRVTFCKVGNSGRSTASVSSCKSVASVSSCKSVSSCMHECLHWARQFRSSFEQGAKNSHLYHLYQ